MINFFRSRIASFKYAFAGWRYVIRSQKNAWIHLTATVFAIGFSIWLPLSASDWLFIVIAIAFVWSAEFFNTALESVVDLVTDDHEPLAKAGKDAAAAGVLAAAITAMIIGILVLGPPLLEKLRPLFTPK